MRELFEPWPLMEEPHLKRLFPPAKLKLLFTHLFFPTSPKPILQKCWITRSSSHQQASTYIILIKWCYSRCLPWISALQAFAKGKALHLAKPFLFCKFCRRWPINGASISTLPSHVLVALLPVAYRPINPWLNGSNTQELLQTPCRNDMFVSGRCQILAQVWPQQSCFPGFPLVVYCCFCKTFHAKCWAGHHDSDHMLPSSGKWMSADIRVRLKRNCVLGIDFFPSPCLFEDRQIFSTTTITTIGKRTLWRRVSRSFQTMGRYICQSQGKPVSSNNFFVQRLWCHWSEN